MAKGTSSKNELKDEVFKNLLHVLKSRFDANSDRHKGIKWVDVELRIANHPEKHSGSRRRHFLRSQIRKGFYVSQWR
jgi:hypothetical protein